MEIIFKEENDKLFGSTKIIGIGKRPPKLIYGQKAKELREKAKLDIESLAKELDVRGNVIRKLESQEIQFDEKLCNKYIDKFNITKDYFFDLDLETLILNGDGHLLKSFETSEECSKVYDKLMNDYFKSIEKGKDRIIIDFSNLDIK